MVQDEAFFSLRLYELVSRSVVKTLMNNLVNNLQGIPKDKELLEQTLQEAGIDPKRRGETLTIEEFGRLSDALYNQKRNYHSA
ncbi:hypothetical protein GCM10020331_019010 [Ectobacillus funiculus]